MRVLGCFLLMAVLAVAQPYPTFTGLLERISDKSIVLKVGEEREMEFHRTRKTRFVDGADPAKLKRGDRVSIEATQEMDASLTAIRVHLEKPPKGAATSGR